MVAVPGLAAAGNLLSHVGIDHGRSRSASGLEDRPGRHGGRVGDRRMGDANLTVDILHNRATTLVDHSSLADRQPVN